MRTVLVILGLATASTAHAENNVELWFTAPTIGGKAVTASPPAAYKAILKTFERNRAAYERCHARAPESLSERWGTVTVELTIAPSGKVTSAKADGISPEVADCVAQATKDLKFAKRPGKQSVELKQPIEFTRATGYGAMAALGPIGDTKGYNDTADYGTVVLKPRTNPVVGVTAVTIVEGPLTKDAVTRDLSRHLGEMEKCYDEQKPRPRAGRLQVELVVGASGNVSNAKVSGMTPALAECVQQLLRDRIRFHKPDGGSTTELKATLTFKPKKR